MAHIAGNKITTLLNETKDKGGYTHSSNVLNRANISGGKFSKKLKIKK